MLGLEVSCTHHVVFLALLCVCACGLSYVASFRLATVFVLMTVVTQR